MILSDCGSAPSVTLTCEYGVITANWNSSGCNHVACQGKLSCTNGTHLHVEQVNENIITYNLIAYSASYSYWGRVSQL